MAKASSQLSNYILFLIVAVAVVPPIVLILTSSFSVSNGPASSPTFQYYLSIFTKSTYARAFLNSFLIALIVAVSSTVLGAFIAWAIHRTRSPYIRRIEWVFVIPFALSPIINSMAWVSMLDPKAGLLDHFLNSMHVGIPDIYSIYGVIIVSIPAATALVYLLIRPFFMSMDSSLEEASYTCGIGTWNTLFDVTIKLALPTILSAFLLSFLWSIQELGIPLVLISSQNIPLVPIEIFVATASYPQNYALASSIGVMVMIIGIIVYTLAERSLRKSTSLTVGALRLQGKRFEFSRFVFSFVIIAYAIIAIILPYLAMLLQGLSPSQYFFRPVNFQALGLANFQGIFTNPTTQDAISNSFIISLIGGGILTFFVFFVSYASYRTRFRFRTILAGISTVPIAVPGIVIAVGIFLLFARYMPNIIYGSIWAIMIALMMRFIGQGMRTISPAVVRIDKAMEESARITGSTHFKVLREITIPSLAPALLATFMLLFMYFNNEFATAVFLYTSTSIVTAVAIYQLWDAGIFNLAMALSTFQLVLVAVVWNVAEYFRKRSQLGSHEV